MQGGQKLPELTAAIALRGYRANGAALERIEAAMRRSILMSGWSPSDKGATFQPPLSVLVTFSSF